MPSEPIPIFCKESDSDAENKDLDILSYSTVCDTLLWSLGMLKIEAHSICNVIEGGII